MCRHRPPPLPQKSPVRQKRTQAASNSDDERCVWNKSEARAVGLLTSMDVQPGSPDESSLSLQTCIFPPHQLGFKRTVRCRGTLVLVSPVFLISKLAASHKVKSASFAPLLQAVVMERAPMTSIIVAKNSPYAEPKPRSIC